MNNLNVPLCAPVEQGDWRAIRSREWFRARVNIDYHIAFDSNHYSVPYNLVHEPVEVRTTPTTIEVFHKRQRVASHLRAHGHGHAVTIEEIDYRTARGLDKSVIRSLTQQSVWVGAHENIFVLGPMGVGKSFVACALAQKACRDGYSALYARAQSLFRDLAMARADDSLRSVLVRLSRIDVLVIDDWAMAPRSEPERRVVPNGRRIEMRGDSMRKSRVKPSS